MYLRALINQKAHKTAPGNVNNHEESRAKKCVLGGELFKNITQECECVVLKTHGAHS